MGERAPLDVEEARAALTHGGRLRIDQTVGERVRATRRRQFGWAKYERIEASLLDGLLAGSLIDVLMPVERAPLPSIIDARWADVAHSHRAMVDGSTTGEALAWFGGALLFVLEGKRLDAPARHRPWAWSFDRAERRVAQRGLTRPPTALFADFAADRIYGLRWCEEGSLAGELLSLQVALGCAAVIADALFAASSANATADTAARRRERAAAEAIMVAEVALSGPLAHVRFETTAESAILASIGVA